MNWAESKRLLTSLMFLSEGVWPRLQALSEKPHWISVDFDHWEYQHDGSEEEEEEERKKLDPEMMRKMVCKGRIAVMGPL